jgi:riboflavin kinase/FMN adenylyltransferase
VEVITDTNDVNAAYDKNTVLTVGTFDGVHLGHREIIGKLVSVKEKKGYRAVVVTFDPHPQIVLRNRNKDIKLLSTTDEKLEIFSSLGIDIVYIISFTKEFSQTPARDFYVNYLINKIGLSELVLGYDHMFGKNREGSFETLAELSKEFGFSVDKVGEYKPEGEHVSSTAIRNLLTGGDVRRASKILGHEYSFQGEVIHGDKRGREIGFPTANLEPLDEFKLIPGKGIYAVRAEHAGETYGGMMYIGLNETFTDGNALILEVNIFDFTKEIYGDKVKVSFVDKVREDMKFGSAEELVKQMEMDKEAAKRLLTTENTERTEKD